MNTGLTNSKAQTINLMPLSTQGSDQHIFQINNLKMSCHHPYFTEEDQSSET